MQTLEPRNPRFRVFFGWLVGWLIFFSETRFLCVALAVLELTLVDKVGFELRNLLASAS